MRIVYLLLGLLLLTPISAHAGPRVALVIGNSAYAVGPLANPGRDAAAVARAFEDLGFDKVVLKTDLTAEGMKAALGEVARASTGADIAVIYYAGHGTERDGRNYLIPVDAKLDRASDLDLQTIALTTVIDQIGGASKLKLVILDACRNNVFPLAGAKRAVTRGLARVEPEENTLVVYAAKEGAVADDGNGRDHSPFTAALLKHVATSGMEIRLLFGAVRDDVAETTNRQQQPHMYGTLGKEPIYFTGSAVSRSTGPRVDEASATRSAIVDPCKAAEAHWSGADSIGSRGVYEDHVKRFPTCAFAELARTKLANLQQRDTDLAARRERDEKDKRERVERRKTQAPDIFSQKAIDEISTYARGFADGKYMFGWEINGFDAARQLGFSRLFASFYEEIRQWLKQEAAKNGPISIDRLKARIEGTAQDEQAIAEVAAKRDRHFGVILYLRAMQYGEIGFSLAETPSQTAILTKLAELFPNVGPLPEDPAFAAALDELNAFAQERATSSGSVSMHEIIRELRSIAIRSASRQPKATN